MNIWELVLIKSFIWKFSFEHISEILQVTSVQQNLSKQIVNFYLTDNFLKNTHVTFTQTDPIPKQWFLNINIQESPGSL